MEINEKYLIRKEKTLERLRNVWGDKYDFSESEFFYENNSCHTTVICHKIDPVTGLEHGRWTPDLGNLLRGCGCPKCANCFSYNTEYFTKKLSKMYGDYFTFEKTKYVNQNTNVVVTDKYGVDHVYLPYNLLSGRLLTTIKTDSNIKHKTEKKRKQREKKFIEKVKKLYGDEYDTKDLYYENSKTPVSIKHKVYGQLEVKPSVFLHNIKIYKDFYPTKQHDLILTARKINTNIVYTKEYCMELAKQCNTYEEFRNKTKTGYKKALKFGWIKDYTWLKYTHKFRSVEDKVHYVYMYDFGNKTIYVGRTNNPKRRDSEHRNYYISSKGNICRSAVLEYSQENNIEIPSMTILESNLNLRESRIKEDFWVNKYKEIGYNVLNKAKTGEFSGSIGTYIKIWTNKMLNEKTSNYKSIRAFLRDYPGASSALSKKEVRDRFFPNRQAHTFYTYNDCREEAIKFETLGEFRGSNRSMYNKALKSGWISDFFLDTSEIKRRNYWDYEHCKEAAKQFKTKTQFGKGNSRAYQVSLKKGWIDEFFPKKVWTYEECVNEAKKYNNRTEFYKGSNKAYSASKENGWINELFPWKTK